MTNKVTFVRLEDTHFGGAENFLRRLIKALDQRNIAHDTRHASAPKWLPSWIKALWFNREARAKKGQQFYFALSRIDSADIYRAGDGVHRVFMRRVGKHFWSNPMHVVACWLERRCFERAAKIIANSHMVKQEIIDTYPIAAGKISVIYNGIEPEVRDRFADRQAICQEFKLDMSVPIVLFVGSGWQRKGGDIFLQLLAQVNAPFQALMVGKDKRLAQYQKLAHHLGISDQVTFVGQRRDILRFYAAADILLFPPRYEPFANVVLEALSQHCVVLTSDGNGAAEILPSDQVIPLAQPEHIVPQLQLLLSDEALRVQRQQDNHAIVAQYTMTRCADETMATIEPFISSI